MNTVILHSSNEMDWTCTFWNMTKFIRRGLTFLEEFTTIHGLLSLNNIIFTVLRNFTPMRSMSKKKLHLFHSNFNKFMTDIKYISQNTREMCIGQKNVCLSLPTRIAFKLLKIGFDCFCCCCQKTNKQTKQLAPKQTSKQTKQNNFGNFGRATASKKWPQNAIRKKIACSSKLGFLTKGSWDILFFFHWNACANVLLWQYLAAIIPFSV